MDRYRGVECVTDSGGPDKELTPAERRAERIAAARTALAEAYAADPGSVDRFNGRMARIEAARKRERRSAEHTSELQSLMSISYAEFCLNKTNKKQEHIVKQN